MPPKKKKKGGGKTKLDRAKAISGFSTKKKVIDKTFGMKNKNKSKRVQKDIRAIKMGQEMAGKSHKQMKMEERARAHAAKMAKIKAANKDMEGDLFKTVTVKQKHDKNVDPKTILCTHFKAGKCNRGKKCKFSHDIKVERKVQKRNVYADTRRDDTMDKWDQNKLEEVVNSKKRANENETQIICKYFLDALEEEKYGWFWKCPNGGNDCKYKHCLPQGYVLKSKSTAVEDDEDAPSIAEQIEEERRKLNLVECTPITLESFNIWKEKQKAIDAQRLADRLEELKKGKQGKVQKHLLSGRDLFRYDPSLFVDDDDAADEDEYEVEDEFYTEGMPGEKAKEDDNTKVWESPAVDDVAKVMDKSLFLDDEDLPADDE